MASDVRTVLKKHLVSIDDDTLDYFDSMISEGTNAEYLKEALFPFIESYDSREIDVMKICDKIVSDLGIGEKNEEAEDEDAPQLLEKTMKLSAVADSHLNEEDRANLESMWGFEGIRKKRNDAMEFSEAASAKYERKAAKEQRKWLEDLEAQFVGEEDNNNVTTMVLPDYSSGSGEKDIHVHNFNITYGGKILLESADLRLVYGRRYGLIGRNGIGKTTLLKHIANFEIEGFPRHHRVLHVKQEVKSSDLSVLEVVLQADIERITLLERQQKLEELQDSTSSEDSKALEKVINQLSEVHERLKLINADTAEARACSILSGLQFSAEMQRSPTKSLSGGWRMRVSIAAALLIEPDLLMLDEPTNHLDLEAVLWLEHYLVDYPKTVLLVSHDRAFLNEVCTDVVLFDKLKLIYYKGDYDMFEGNRHEQRVVQQKQFEAQQVKLQHMQEFVDKFRYNAKRASLVQSRIKAIEKEVLVEAVEDEDEFHFNFFDAGQVGRPVIQVEGVSFGYSLKKTRAEALLLDIHVNVDQTSRIALVGPNGAGKSTLLNLIQNKLVPWDGVIRINPNLKIGVFTQHHMDSFDLNISPLQNMMVNFPFASEAELRAHLGKFEVTGNDALKPMKFSSGGQKSKVAFANLTYHKPHVVIMDEPTNHLDMITIEALIESLQKFTGGVLVVSHDQHFITKVCNEIWVIDDHHVKRFDGEFHDYKKLVLGKNKGK